MSSNPRIFTPQQQIPHNPAKTITHPSDILHHDPETGTRKLVIYPLFAPSTPRVVPHSLVVAIASASNPPRAAYGLYFAPSSPLNSSGLLPAPSHGSHPTPQQAALYALRKVLDVVEARFQDAKISRLVLVTDVAGLVEGLTERVWEWEFKGYRGVDGGQVVNGDVFRELHGRVGRLEGRGVDVCFWGVERGWNAEAQGMADAVIDADGE